MHAVLASDQKVSLTLEATPSLFVQGRLLRSGKHAWQSCLPPAHGCPPPFHLHTEWTVEWTVLISIGRGLDTTHPGACSAENPHTAAYSICRPGGGGLGLVCSGLWRYGAMQLQSAGHEFYWGQDFVGVTYMPCHQICPSQRLSSFTPPHRRSQNKYSLKYSLLFCFAKFWYFTTLRLWLVP